MMQITTINMTMNRVKNAKIKLSQHRDLGNRSSLTVYEVAQLMDTIKYGEKAEENAQDSIFFSLN